MSRKTSTLLLVLVSVPLVTLWRQSYPLTGQLYVAGYSQAHPELCPSHGAHLRLLVLVMSAPSHATARDAVRLTWGHYAARRDIALAFVIGAPPLLRHSHPKLAIEDAVYGDLIVGNSLDSYPNLSLKTLSMLEWTATYCEQAPHVLKVDDDVFLNVPLLLSFLENHVNATRTIWGKVLRKSVPHRNNNCKLSVSEQEWGGRVYPAFTTGPAYLMTSDCVAPLLAAASSLPYLHLEDVFVTGVLAAKLGIERVHEPAFYNWMILDRDDNPCTIRRTISVHLRKSHEQFHLWRKLFDKTKCPSKPWWRGLRVEGTAARRMWHPNITELDMLNDDEITQ